MIYDLKNIKERSKSNDKDEQDYISKIGKRRRSNLDTMKKFIPLKKKKSNNNFDVKKFLKSNTTYFDPNPENQNSGFLEYQSFIKRQTEAMLYSKFTFNSGLQALIAFITIFSSSLTFEVSRVQIRKGFSTSDQKIVFPQFMAFVMTLFLIYTIIYDYHLKYELIALDLNRKPSIIKFKMSKLIWLIFELVVFFWHPNPVLSDVINYVFLARYEGSESKYLINTIFGVISFMRIWYLVKFYFVYSKFYCSRTARLGRLYGSNIGILYALKATLVAVPMLCYGILFVSFFTFGFLSIRFFESPLVKETQMTYTIWDSMWLSVITMTTVGYGDFFPNSIGGRIIVMFTCFVANFLTSFMISALSSLFSFEGLEKDVCQLIHRIDLHKQKDQISKELVHCYFKAVKKIKDDARIKGQLPKEEDIRDIKLKLYMEIIELKSITEEINYTYPQPKKVEEFLDGFKEIENVLDNFSSKMIALNNKVNEYSSKYRALTEIAV